MSASDFVPDASIAARFWQKVERKSEDECWNWTASKDRAGYGRFNFVAAGFKAHRFSYMLNVGPISGGLFVCHSCDNPACVNPNHLWLGTHNDNVADMTRKKRNGRYDRTKVPQKPNQRISKETAAEIRRLATAGVNQYEIARSFGVSQSLVSGIKCGTHWPELAVEDKRARQMLGVET